MAVGGKGAKNVRFRRVRKIMCFSFLSFSFHIVSLRNLSVLQSSLRNALNTTPTMRKCARGRNIRRVNWLALLIFARALETNKRKWGHFIVEDIAHPMLRSYLKTCVQTISRERTSLKVLKGEGKCDVRT